MRDRMGKSSKKGGREKENVGQLILVDLYQYLRLSPQGLPGGHDHEGGSHSTIVPKRG